MFSKSITNSSSFLMMSQSAQNLYFHFGMNADDDGFCEHFTVMRMTESKPDDLRVLQARGFVQIFDDKVLVILNWKENNYIQKDRYTPSKYLEVYKKEIKLLEDGQTVDNKGVTECIQNVYKMDTQVRLGKVWLGKDINMSKLNILFEFWNEQKIINHKVFTDKIKTKINSALKDYSLEDIKIAIVKYKTVLEGDQYYWNHKWTLPDFLSRGLTRFIDTPIEGFKKFTPAEKEKKKKVYYNGNPVVEKNGKRYVIVDGQWLEFDGEEKDLITKFE